MSKKKQCHEDIKVFIRCRPLMKSELNHPVPVEVHPEVNKIFVRDIGTDRPMVKTYSFDKVFGPEAKQEDIFNKAVVPVIQEVISGFNCTIFAYGQTGTGKTFTIEGGRTPNFPDRSDDPLAGIIPRSMKHLFNDLSGQDMKFELFVSFLELYNEEIFDLLSSASGLTKLRIFDNSSQKGSVIVQGLQVVPVTSMDDIYAILDKGCKKRRKAATLLNKASSRSHTIFTVTVNIKETSSLLEKVKSAKLNVVDLAGSENIGRSGAIDKRAKEAGNINQSLLSLGRVITSLCEKNIHIPYRESKLTRLLQDSLGGQTKTAIIATISPFALHVEETINTLEYALRAKSITNKPEINAQVTASSLTQDYLEEIIRLKKSINELGNKKGFCFPEEHINHWESTIASTREEKFRLLQKIEELTNESKLLDNVIAEASNTASEKKSQLEDVKIRCEEYKAQLEKEKVDLKLDEEVLQVMQPLHDNFHQMLHKQFEEMQDMTSEAKKIKEKINYTINERRNVRKTLEAIREQRKQWNEKLHSCSENLLKNIRNSNDSVNSIVSECDNSTAVLKDSLEDRSLLFEKDFANLFKAVSDLEIANESFQSNVETCLLDEKSSNLKWIDDFENACTESNETSIFQPLNNASNKCETSLLSISSSLNDWKQDVTSEINVRCEVLKEHLENQINGLELTVNSVKELFGKHKEIMEPCNNLIIESLDSSTANKKLWNEKFLEVEKALSALDVFCTEKIKNEVEATTKVHTSLKNCSSIRSEISQKLTGFCESSAKNIDTMQKNADFHEQNVFSGKWEELKTGVDLSCSRYKDLNSELARCSAASQNPDRGCSSIESLIKKKVNEMPKVTQCIQDMSDSFLKQGDTFKSLLTEKKTQIEESLTKDKMDLKNLTESLKQLSGSMNSTLLKFNESLEVDLLQNLTTEADSKMNMIQLGATQLESTFDLDETITMSFEDAINECPVCSKRVTDETLQAGNDDGTLPVDHQQNLNLKSPEICAATTSRSFQSHFTISTGKRPCRRQGLSARKCLQFHDVEKLTQQLLEISSDEGE